MGIYRITGVWKNSDGVITHYAVHERFMSAGVARIRHAIKMKKEDAITLVDNPNNSATTMIWNYIDAVWYIGGAVHVVHENPPFLRTTHDNEEKDNLLHLIDYGKVFNP